MNMNIEDKLFTLKNGKEYIVLETIDYEGKKYAYLSNKDNELDTMFVGVNMENGIKFEKIDPSYLQETILPLFFKKFKDYE